MREAKDLQTEIDAFANAGGGTFTIPEGTYLLRDSLHLRSGVHLVGQGNVTFLKLPSVQSRVADFLGYGFYEFTVEEPDQFYVGMGVHLTDKRSMGFYDTVGTIIERTANGFILDEPLHHDYLPYDEGTVTSIFPLVSGKDVYDASLSQVRLDGNIEETRFLNGCRGGGVFLIRSQQVRLEWLEIQNYQGDGISFQQCAEVEVNDCHIHDNKGSGLHPGSGSVGYTFTNNRLISNGGCGIFYCLRTTHSRCKGNLISKNAHTGISIGERDTDHHLLQNVIRKNGHDGIGFRKPIAQGGDRVLIERNRLENNGTAQPSYEITIPAHIKDIYILDNAFAPFEGRTISIGDDCTNICIAQNTADGSALHPTNVQVAQTSIQVTMPQSLPKYGYSALDLKSVRHIHLKT